MKSSINLYVMFSFNYPHDFIEKVWAGLYVAEHLRTKFNSMYNTYGASGVFNRFYCELDQENQMRLEIWILENYKG